MVFVRGSPVVDDVCSAPWLVGLAAMVRSRSGSLAWVGHVGHGTPHWHVHNRTNFCFLQWLHQARWSRRLRQNMGFVPSVSCWHPGHLSVITIVDVGGAGVVDGGCWVGGGCKQGWSTIGLMAFDQAALPANRSRCKGTFCLAKSNRCAFVLVYLCCDFKISSAILVLVVRLMWS